MNSIWTETAQLREFPALPHSAKTDVLIIGGGMAGLLCAYFLHRAGVEYLLLEGRRLGSGVSKNTTAKLTSQHGLLYHQLLRDKGPELAGQYLAANEEALGEYRRLCAGLDCDFEEKDAYVYSMDDRGVIEAEAAALQTLGFPAQLSTELPLPFRTAGAVRFPRQAQFHPLKFMDGIAEGLHIYENSFVRELGPGFAVTDRGEIRARHIIVATHFPFLNKHGGYWLKLYQSRSYAIALEGAAQVEGMYLGAGETGLSFRNYGDCLIVGGGDHRTGHPGGNWAVLRDFTGQAYPKARVKYAWAAQDCMSLDSVPYIGRYGRRAEGLYVAAGFNKWGMSSSMVAARLLTDEILGRQNDCAAVFSPQRSMLQPQLLANGLSAVGNLLRPTVPRCPHLGCALRWNPAEHSWDCPCHGSRFDENGKLLDNPATGQLTMNKEQ